MIVIGTAGHIDHGKSSIVKRLTGTDPDRLPEEKQRGMTIDLGFAFYNTTTNETIAFVDVPGHERFVKNMIAGAGGIDVVMLVIAADDGWMPQTEEHFQIVRLLGVRTGLIVINKCDLADDSLINNLEEEIRRRTKDSFLSIAPILTVSTITGDGFRELEHHLNTLPAKVAARRDIGKARLPIDRVFVKQGIGTVVTGTLKDGTFRVGQTVSVWPSLKKGKIKVLQSNSQDIKTARPGQRTALSLTGFDKNDFVRGDTISANHDLSYFNKKPVLALKLELLNNTAINLENRRKIQLLAGTAETEGKVVLYDRERIRAGESGIVFFKPETLTYALIGDAFIARLPTPMVTLGGGVVLDHLESLPVKNGYDGFSYLRSRDVNNLEKLIKSELRKLIAVKREELLNHSILSQQEIIDAVNKLVQSEDCTEANGYVFETETMRAAAVKLLKTVSALIKEKKELRGVALDEITENASWGREVVKVVLNELVKSQKLFGQDDYFRVENPQAHLPREVAKAAQDILSNLRFNPYTPPVLAILADKGKDYQEAIGHLVKSRQVHKCGTEFLFLDSTWNEIQSFIKNALFNQKQLTVGELRDKFKITRKYAVPILEEMDRIKLTRREGDVRVKGEKFEA